MSRAVRTRRIRRRNVVGNARLVYSRRSRIVHSTKKGFPSVSGARTATHRGHVFKHIIKRRCIMDKCNNPGALAGFPTHLRGEPRFANNCFCFIVQRDRLAFRAPPISPPPPLLFLHCLRPRSHNRTSILFLLRNPAFLPSFRTVRPSPNRAALRDPSLFLRLSPPASILLVFSILPSFHWSAILVHPEQMCVLDPRWVKGSKTKVSLGFFFHLRFSALSLFPCSFLSFHCRGNSEGRGGEFRADSGLVSNEATVE